VQKPLPAETLRTHLVVAVCAVFLQGSSFGLVQSVGPGGSNATALQDLGWTGQGIDIAVILARNVQATHEAFQDANGVAHAINYDFSGDGIEISAHDTRLVGIMLSNGGAAFPDYLGVAPSAIAHCARVSAADNTVSGVTISEALTTLIDAEGCKIVVTGFELPGLAGDGESFWTVLYDYFAYDRDVIFANAAGNQNTLVTVFGDAYNGITTGGLRLSDPADQTSYLQAGTITGTGPTDDNRHKPDIIAPSQSQTVPTSGADNAWATIGSTAGETSYSVPHAAGAAALLLSATMQTPDPDDERTVVIKAAIVNATFPNIDNKGGTSTGPVEPNNTWNQDRGYGRVDALRAYNTLTANRLSRQTVTVASRGWAFDSLEAGQSHYYVIQIDKPGRLIVTLTWHRRVDWIDQKRGFPPRTNGVIEPDELHPHLADLDLYLYPPESGEMIFNETIFGLDPNNNLEKCDLPVSEPGDYYVIVFNDSGDGESAEYALAYEFHPILTGDTLPYDYIVDIDDLMQLTSVWLTDNPIVESSLLPDGIIDMRDFAAQADNWLVVDEAYYQRP
jgi:hypothetical protein